GMRPAVPATIADGSGLPCETTATDGEPLSSVVVRLPLDAPPGRNSFTVPLTCARSPTLTELGADDVKTKIPSDVAGSASHSASGASSQKPFVAFAVTTPFVDTTRPLSGEMCAAPWMSWIATSGPSTE